MEWMKWVKILLKIYQIISAWLSVPLLFRFRWIWAGGRCLLLVAFHINKMLICGALNAFAFVVQFCEVGKYAKCYCCLNRWDFGVFLFGLVSLRFGLMRFKINLCDRSIELIIRHNNGTNNKIPTTITIILLTIITDVITTEQEAPFRRLLGQNKLDNFRFELNSTKNKCFVPFSSHCQTRNRFSYRQVRKLIPGFLGPASMELKADVFGITKDEQYTWCLIHNDTAKSKQEGKKRLENRNNWIRFSSGAPI